MDDASLKLAELRKICRGEPEVKLNFRNKGISRLFSIYSGKKYFRDIDGLLTEDTVRLIYGGPTPALSLQELAGRIADFDRFRFWKRIFELREHIPDEVVFHFWYECMTDRSVIAPLLQYYKSVERSSLDLPDPDLMENLPLTDELLIDNHIVYTRYCRERKPGWKMLRCLCPGLAAGPKLPERMYRAIEEDSAETFMILRDMAGIRLSYGLLERIMRKRALNIFAELLKEGRLFDHSVTPEKLCARCATQFEDALSVPFLEAVEEYLPGTVKDVRDRWGRNLLWYAAANLRTAFFHPFCRLTPFLLKCGCDPENENQLGISWRYMLNHLSYLQKASLLEERQWKIWKSPVKRSQPLYALTDRSYEPQWLKELYGDR